MSSGEVTKTKQKKSEINILRRVVTSIEK